MSIEEFEAMSYPFGWKVEYWDDQAHLSPREYNVRTKMSLERRKVNKALCLTIADVFFKGQMIETFFEAFQDSVEFCDWSTGKIRAHAEQNIADYFHGVRGKPLPHSVVALETDKDQLIDLALFVEKREGRVELDLLYVTPAHQGAGVATEMVGRAANILHESGVRELYSAYHICNERSRDWQHKFGFGEVLEQFYCRLKYSWCRHEVWRGEKLGAALADLECLKRQRDEWFERLEDPWKY